MPLIGRRCPPRLCRRCGRSTRHASTLSKTVKQKPGGLDRLVKQDSEGRVRFLPPIVPASRVTEQFGSADWTLHLVPFWTIILLCNVKRTFQDFVKERTIENAFSNTDIGCSIAAVPRDHWCSGLVLRDDLRMLVGAHQAHRATTTTQCYSKIAKQASTTLAGSPDFAFSYPHLDKYDLQDLAALASHKNRESAETWTMNSEPAVFAIPTYRAFNPLDECSRKGPAYKVNLHGRVAYVDGYFDLPSHHLPLSHRATKRSTNRSWSAQSTLGFYARRVFDDGFWTTQVGKQPLLPVKRNVQLGEILLRAMWRSPIDWSDSAIIPLSGQSPSGVSVARRANERVISSLINPDQASLALQIPRSELPPDSSRPAASFRPTQKPAPEAVKPLPINLHDHKGHYRLLGIIPTPTFLEARWANAVALILREKRRQLAKIYHGDISGKGDAEMAAINAAFDSVRTVELRRAYNVSGSWKE